jgi:hypothetical protein
LSQLEDSPRLRALVEWTADEVQRAEDVAWDLLDKRLLENAEGVLLDIFGKIVDMPRLDAETDEAYRRLISVAAVANNSDTLADTLAYIASEIVGQPVRYRWDGPMAVNLEYETDTPVTDIMAARATVLLDRAVAGGTSWRLSEGVLGEALRYDDGPGWDVGRLGRLVASGGLPT